MGTTRDGADVSRSLGRRGKLHNANCGEGWSSEGAPLFPYGAFRGEEGRCSCKVCEEISSSRSVIDVVSNPSRYCSSASPKVHLSRLHSTKKKTTYVDRRPCRIRPSSERASMRYMLTLSHGTSLPLRGSAVMWIVRLRPARMLVVLAFPLEGK